MWHRWRKDYVELKANAIPDVFKPNLMALARWNIELKPLYRLIFGTVYLTGVCSKYWVSLF